LLRPASRPAVGAAAGAVRACSAHCPTAAARPTPHPGPRLGRRTRPAHPPRRQVGALGSLQLSAMSLASTFFNITGLSLVMGIGSAAGWGQRLGLGASACASVCTWQYPTPPFSTTSPPLRPQQPLPPNPTTRHRNLLRPGGRHGGALAPGVGAAARVDMRRRDGGAAARGVDPRAPAAEDAWAGGGCPKVCKLCLAMLHARASARLHAVPAGGSKQ
jgi:hypothetical protein